MDRHLEVFLERFGAATQPSPAAVETIARYRGKLPDKLLEYWQDIGFSSFMNGLFWVTDPAEFDDSLEAWLGDTSILEEDAYHVIGRSGFGDLYLWGEKNGHKYVLNPANGWVLQEDGDRSEIASRGGDSPLKRFFAVITPEFCDLSDEKKNALFARAVAKFGPLARDEVFAFEPALMAGGKATLDHIGKRNIHVHLSILAQFGQREILNRQALARKAFG